MSDDCFDVTIPDYAFAVIVDALQETVIDRGASRTARRAAFTALLALVEAGLVSDASADSPAENENSAAPPVRPELRVMR